MKINFQMWNKALWSLIKMESKEEWDALDPVSKWLIATRSAVTTVTIYACIMAGLLAWRDHFMQKLDRLPPQRPPGRSAARATPACATSRAESEPIARCAESREQARSPPMGEDIAAR